MSATPAHLAVCGFLSTEWDARAIRAALDFGLFESPERADAIAPAGRELLLGLLAANGVISREGGRFAPTPAFRAVLAFRDLLEARIAFADLVWPDIHELFGALLTDVPQFMARSRTFELFRYDRALELNPENRRATEAWTRFTTVLTRYEAPAALDAIDLAGVKSLVDLGGNTGEFALAMRRRAPALRATVADLPVVCAIGRDHAGEAVAFHACDMRRDALPAPADLVSFKSVLHDWPDDEARALLARARDIVKPGGRLLIFERAPLAFTGRPAYGLAPDLVFLHFLRPAKLYLDVLRDLGFVDIELRTVRLEVDFHLILARRP